jgi:hypothetical protein
VKKYWVGVQTPTRLLYWINKEAKMFVEVHSTGNVKFQMMIEPGEYIEIHTYRQGQLDRINKFLVGDVAEYDSYNLKYTAQIKQITKKNVIFELSHKRFGSDKSPTKQMPFQTFAWRNWDFDAVQVAHHNFETMQYI